ncbi:hypothetical protein THMIRHAS_09400 [Thiosulfatimonas sediminis]|uniref:Flagellar hook-length control protein-like C-terminal domain-containing protein n=1 Tax=Thiosulfatimonas sediminis TaxID=2675054 RepID=A0A6F8PU61_9GAMM|nr:hypothetical protein [Thiosulfatimonas sediminis]BBP45567.1 hypothetical protein THMIRHAS_09400 [Thiosulfatimonas sediminis]
MLTITGNLNPSQLTSELSKNLLANLKTGQVINADIQQIKDNQVALKVGQNTLLASTKESNIPTGPVQLTVKQTQPTLVLSITARQTTPLEQQQQVLNNALRQHLSNQIPLGQGAQQFTQLLNQLPSSLQAPLIALLDNLRKPLNLESGKSLKLQLENSGLFMENKLLQSANTNLTNSLQNDLKAQLLQFKQLSQTLQNTQSAANNPNLQLASKLSDQMISRITFNQLQLYENPAFTLLDLPNNSQRSVEDQLEFRKYSSQPNNRWEAFINVHTELGEIKSKLSYAEQQTEQLFCGVWCENSALQAQVLAALPQLTEQLQTLQIENLKVELLNQAPQQSKQTQRVALVDIHI